MVIRAGRIHVLVANLIPSGDRRRRPGGGPTHEINHAAVCFSGSAIGRYAGASDQESEFESREAAWTEMTKVCGNLLGSPSRGLKQNRRMADGASGRSQGAAGFPDLALSPNPLVSVQSSVRPRTA